MPEEIIRHIHENKESRPDSIEIGSPSKGGVLKVYFNATSPAEDIQTIINRAITAREYARMKVAETEGKP
jgi:hypothetical protein